MAKDHAEDAAERAEESAEPQQIPLRDTESVLLGLLLVRVEERKRDQVHQNEERQKQKTIFIYELKYKLHTRNTTPNFLHYTANIG